MDKLKPKDDSNAHLRKQDHINLAFQSQMNKELLDNRFYYEPLLSGHPDDSTDIGLTFLGKRMEAPIWISSMTGGAQHAKTINHHLAKAAKEFGLGMGLGSCRHLLYDHQHFSDFDLRQIIGDQPFYANLGIAQVEYQIKNGALHKVDEMLKKLQVDGLIIHINPLQEWIQPEGDQITQKPIDTIRRFLDHAPDTPLIIKEVGQGFGPKSLKLLLQLPLAAIDFAAAGGTNFSKLEMLRRSKEVQEISAPLARIGHHVEEMLEWIQAIISASNRPNSMELIISGGIQNYLDGYYLVSQSPLKAVYGQASNFLRHAQGDYQNLQDFVSSQIQGYKLAQALLTVKPKSSY